MQQRLSITGMHCNACVGKVTKALAAVPGVTSVNVTLSPPAADVQAAREVPLAEFAEAAQGAGPYGVREWAAVPVAAPTTKAAASTAESGEPRPSLFPLFLIVAYTLGTVLIIAAVRGSAEWRPVMNHFMVGFFLVFSFFKMLDLRGFVQAYRMYDLIAERSRVWAYAYPFVELALGLAYLTAYQPRATNIATLALMVIGSLGVLRALSRKQAIRCACLGTALNLPMTTVTLVEDLAMAVMAGVGLVWGH